MYQMRRIALDPEKQVVLSIHGQGLGKWKILRKGNDFMDLGYSLEDVESHGHIVCDEERGWSYAHTTYYLVDIDKKQLNRMIVRFCGTMFPANFSKKVLFFTSDMNERPVIHTLNDGNKELRFERISENAVDNEEGIFLAYAVDFSEDACKRVKIVSLC